MSIGAWVVNSVQRFSRGSRGGAALELAVAFPFLLLLLIGAVDYGRLYYTSVTVANAARAGAEYGAQDIATSQDTAAIKSFALLDGAERTSTMHIAARAYCECGKVAHACNGCSGGAAPDTY